MYECVRCEGSARPTRNTLAYVQSHIQKMHLTADECPEYCALCDFRANNHSELVRHVSHFVRHRRLVEAQRRMGVVVEDEIFYRRGSKVHVFGESDFKVYDRQQVTGRV